MPSARIYLSFSRNSEVARSLAEELKRRLHDDGGAGGSDSSDGGGAADAPAQGGASLEQPAGESGALMLPVSHAGNTSTGGASDGSDGASAGVDSEPARGPRTSSSCGCRVAGGDERASFAGSLALSLALLRRRRRRAAGGRAAARP